MSQLRIRTLRGLDVEADGRPLSGPVPAKGRALLAYLAVVGGRADRSRLAGLLWSDVPEASARQNLRHALTRLRRAVEHVQADRKDVWLDSTWSVDTADIESLSNADASSVDPGEVLDLVRGEFLDGIELPGAELFGEWVTATRAHLRSLAVALLGAVVTRALAGEVPSTSGIAAARRVLELEPADETAHRWLMQLFADAGQPSAALAQYDTCMHVMFAELGERPTEQTAGLADDIRRRSTDEPSSPRLPPRRSSFVGRDAELDRLDRLVTDPACRLVTVVGVGGIGKTRLALEFARAWTAGDQQAAFVSFAGVAPGDDHHLDEAVVTTLAAGLDIELEAGRDPFDVLVDRIAGPELLLVVDNLEHLPGAGRNLTRILDAAPQLRVLATSRRRLAVGAEWVLPLDGLATPDAAVTGDTEGGDAVRLFLERADAAGAGRALDPVEIGALCRALGGIPLAIELAARRAAVMPVRDIRTRLDSALDLLAGAEDAERRHRSIRATLDWSWELLDAEVADGFGRLSVFPGGFTASAAEGVAGVGLLQLGELVEHSLLTLNSDGRYWMHPLVRRYGMERLEDGSTTADELRRRHALWVAGSLAASSDDTAPDDAISLDDERSATGWMLEHATTEELAGYLRNLAETYRRRSWWSELRIAVEAALDRDELVPTLRAEWLMLTAEAHGNIGNPGDAVDVAWEAVAELGRPPPDSPAQRLRWVLRDAATAVGWRLGLLSSAEHRDVARRREMYLQRAAELASISRRFDRIPPVLLAGVEGRVSGDPSALAQADAAFAFGAIVGRRGRLARRYRDRAVARIDGGGVAGDIAAQVLHFATAVSLALGDWGDATRDAARALAICDHEDLHQQAELALLDGAIARYHSGDHATALEHAQEVIARATRRDASTGLTWAELVTAESTLRGGQLDRATAAAQRALELASAVEMPVDRVRALVVLGRTAAAEHRWDDAVSLVSDAAGTLSDRATIVLYAVEGHAGVPELALDLLEADRGSRVDLDTIVRRGATVLRSYAAAVQIAAPRLHLVEGRLAQLHGRRAAAQRSYDRAAKAADRLAMPWEAREAARRRASAERP